MRFWAHLFDRSGGVSVPPMDGAFRPNTRLDQAEVVARLPAPDNLTWNGTDVLVTSGAEIVALRGQEQVVRYKAERPITALACDDQGCLVLATGTALKRLPQSENRAITWLEQSHTTALAFADPRTLAVATGSQDFACGTWVQDLMTHGQSGRIDLVPMHGTKRLQKADQLCYAAGITSTPKGLLVSEAWAHRLVLVGSSGQTTPVLTDLPAYPGRLTPAHDGGYWLCLFAPRNQLVEFVLKEHGYRQKMIETIAPSHWIAPSLSSGQDFLQPLQLGAIRTMGHVKPWAPTWSYGLVVHLDADFQPTASAQSRADGLWHGITSALEHDGYLWLTSKGNNAVLRLPVSDILGAGT